MRVPPPNVAGHDLNGGSSPSLFTDRLSESEVFSTSLTQFRAILDAPEDVGTWRRNILVFHGVGGIGKTALSRRLEDWSRGRLAVDDQWGRRPATEVSTATRIDLHGSSGQIDLVGAIIGLRSALAIIEPRWPIFDLAFAAYWSAVRPGESLPELKGGRDFGAAVSETMADVLSDVGSIVDLTGAGTGVGLGMRAFRRLVSEIRRRRSLQQALGAFEGFDTFLLRCTEEPSPTNAAYDLLVQIAGILSWELTQRSPTSLVVAFVDTAERLAIDPRRVAEGYLNQLVFNMPNVLFVVTGRNRLDWADESRADLQHRGSWIWPGLSPLADQEPQQHRVGNLSTHDARIVMTRARDQLELPISDGVIDRVVQASGGFPQYLELARQVAINVKSANSGRTVQVSDVTGSLGSLVQRVLDDIPKDERRAIQSATLFQAFDVELVAAAANVDVGCVERAVLRPMVDKVPVDRLPYRMHDAIRVAIRSDGSKGEGAWSEGDWQQASTRAAAHIRKIHHDAVQAGTTREILDAIGLVVHLVCGQKTMIERDTDSPYRDWLAQAVVYAPSVQGLRSRVPVVSATEYGQRVLDFVRAKMLDTPIDDQLRLLRGVFDSDHVLAMPAGRHLGYTLRRERRWDEALAIFLEVSDRSPTAVNLRQRPLTLATARRFVDAEAATAGNDAAASVRRISDYAHGKPENYFSSVHDSIKSLRKQGRYRESLEERSDLLFRRAFFEGPMLTEEEIDEFAEEAELAGHDYAARSALGAAVLRGGTSAIPGGEALQLLRAMENRAYHGVLGFRYAFAAICHEFRSRESADFASLWAEVKSIEPRSRSWIPVECFYAYLGLPLPAQATQWLEPVQVVESRWKGHLDQYLESYRLRS